MSQVADSRRVDEYSKSSSSNVKIYIFLAISTVFTIVAFALSAATLATVIDRVKESDSSEIPLEPKTLVDSITREEIMEHVAVFQEIADTSGGGGTRAITTPGFDGTIDYITKQLREKTKFNVQRQNFVVKNYLVRGTPELQAEINGVRKDYSYLSNFTYMVFAAKANFPSSLPLVIIPQLGCSDTDWAGLSTSNAVVLVKRGDCTFVDKVDIAEKYGAAGLLLYNDGQGGADRLDALQGVRTKEDATIPAFFLSYNTGMDLIREASAPGATVRIRMNVDVSDAENIANICADTPTGDPTKTIVIGAHCDSVPAGSGINDNGSGSIGILILALNLAKLMNKSTSDYSKYYNRIRFCWWGAEELGLLGSYYHVAQAASPSETRIGERLVDYLMNLNYDMLAGPNYRFGIHDSTMVPPNTPTSAGPGTYKLTQLFREWYTEQKLPWSNSSLGGGSDYIPFLARGIAVGGVNTGAGGVKPASERDQYTAKLGVGFGGIANAAYDPCYHQQCDRSTNLNLFAFENVVKSAAYAIEKLGREKDLEKWLYPNGRSYLLTLKNEKPIYDIVHYPEMY